MHEFDLMRALLAQGGRCRAMTGELHPPGRDYEDHVIATCASATVDWDSSNSAAPRHRRHGGPVTGDWRRRLRLGAKHRTPTAQWEGPAGRRAGREGRRAFGIKSELASFARWVLYDEAPVVTSEDGRRAVQLGEAAYRSVAEGRADRPPGLTVPGGRRRPASAGSSRRSAHSAGKSSRQRARAPPGASERWR